MVHCISTSESFFHDRHEKDAQVTNRACMYYLDIPVLSPDERSLDSLRALKLQEASRQNSRSVRARIERKTPAEYCVKFTPYDNSSYQGRDLVNYDSLASIFKSLRVLLDNDQVKRRTLPRCKWNSADVAALRSLFPDCFSFVLNFKNTVTWFRKDVWGVESKQFFYEESLDIVRMCSCVMLRYKDASVHLMQSNMGRLYRFISAKAWICFVEL